MCKNSAHCKINDDLLLNSGLCVKPYQCEWHKVHKRKNFDYIIICSEVTAQTGEACQFYCDP